MCIRDRNTLIHGGDHLLMKLTPEQEFSLSPMELDIIYEDEYILVINKATGILMHPTSTVRDHTLANGVLHYYQETNQHYDFHPVHRLDKDTSGIVIIAKTSVVQHAFDKKHTHFYKIYDAIVEGHLPSMRISINSVSYTHLDVYKRQMLTWASCFLHDANRCFWVAVFKNDFTNFKMCIRDRPHT